jgi:hypothetical protein
LLGSPEKAGVGGSIPSLATICGVEMWRGSVGRAYLFPALSFSRCLISPTMLRFHIPLIEPDVRY